MAGQWCLLPSSAKAIAFDAVPLSARRQIRVAAASVSPIGRTSFEDVVFCCVESVIDGPETTVFAGHCVQLGWRQSVRAVGASGSGCRAAFTLATRQNGAGVATSA